MLVLVRIRAKGLADDRRATQGVAWNQPGHIGTDARFDFQGDQSGTQGIEPESIAYIQSETSTGRAQNFRLVFEIKDNKARRPKPSGAVELPEAAKQAEIAQMDARIEMARSRWKEADADQRAKWLEQMNDVSRMMAPAAGKEPGRAFASCLGALLEPELALS